VNAWRRLHDHYAVDQPQEGFIPIRAQHAVPDEIKRLLSKVDTGQILTSEDVEGLSPRMAEDLNRFLFPNPEEGHLEGVRWLDPRYLADQPMSNRLSLITKVFSNINEPLRDLTLFVRPAYLMNVFNSTQMAAMHQGWFIMPNFVRALKAEQFYGKKAANILDAMAGEGRMQSYAPAAGGITKISHALAGAWNVVTDKFFRRAAVIHEMRKLGFRTSEQITEALHGSLHDDELKAKIVEASQRAKKAMVELDNLTPVEKNVLRHYIFVYPWVSRSAVWSLRTIFEHPIQSAILAEIGKQEALEEIPLLKHLPSFMQDNGYVPIGTDSNGDPLMINPGSVNTFATLGEMAGLLRGDQTATDLFGPGADLILHYATQRDRFGRKYKNPIVDPFLDVVGGLPQAAAYKRATAKEPAQKPIDVTNVGALVAREHQDVKRPFYIPGGYWNTYAPLALGGLAARVLDPRAVEARWWQGQPWDVRHQHEAQLVQTMAGVQARFIGKQVPAPVRTALGLASAFTDAVHTFSVAHGRTPTTRERTELEIATLQAQGRLKSTVADELTAQLGKQAPDDLALFRRGVLDKYAGGKELSDWHRMVATVAKVASRQDLDGDIQQLIGSGILPASMKDAANVDQATLVKYGRAYLAYDQRLRDFAAQEKQLRVEGKPVAALAAKMRVYVDQQDKPVVVDGKQLPPLPRLAIARLTPSQLQAHLVSNYTHSVATLSAIDKKLMGLTSSSQVTDLWGQLRAAETQYHAQYPGQPLALSQVMKAATEFDTRAGLKGAFVKEVQLSYLPRFQQYKQERLYLQSPNKPWWDALFAYAGTIVGWLHDPNVDHAAARQQWKTALQTQILPAIQGDKAFWTEVQPYLKADPHFLDNLISR
jgi:hypothetical protein